MMIETAKQATGEPTESLRLEELLSVNIEDDGYAASVTIKETDLCASFISKDIVDYLGRHNVTYGIDTAKLVDVLRAIRKGPAGTSFTIARGDKMMPGKNGSVQLRFKTAPPAATAAHATPVNCQLQEQINNVRAGQIIAVIEKEAAGKPGTKVDGNRTYPPLVSCVNIYEPGINVDRYTDGTTITYVAMVSGNARTFLDEIQVTGDFLVEGNLDAAKGSIDFVGNVGISGDVGSGLEVIAAGNISIGGNVESGAVVKSGKNIVVGGNIRCGREKGRCEAQNTITTRSLASSVIRAGKNVFIKEYAENCEIYCNGAFISSKGTILSATIEAIGGVSICNIGKDKTLSKNIVCAGRNYLTRQRITAIDEEIKNLNNELTALARKVTTEKENSPNGAGSAKTSQQEQIKKASFARANQIRERIEFLEKELSTLKERSSANTEAAIIVTGAIYPTALLRNGSNELKVVDKPVAATTLEYREDNKTT